MNITLISLAISGDNKTAHLISTYTDTGESIDKMCSTYRLINLHPLIEHIYSFKPVGNNADNIYETITIVAGVDATYIPKDGSQSWSEPYSNLKEYLINNLAEEIILIP